MLALTLFLAACQVQTDALPAPSAFDVTEQAPPTPEDLEKGGLRKQLNGEWTLELDADLTAQLAALELAFRDPIPTDEELAAQDLPARAASTATLVVRARRANPDAELLATYRSLLGQMKTQKVVFEGDSLRFGNAESSLQGTYEVLETNENGGRIRITPSEGRARDHLVVFEHTDRVSLTPDGTDRAMVLTR